MTDFYQSPADKLRFEILLKSLLEGSLNLAIIGEDEVALANYGRQIYDHLVEVGETHVEWWNSADSEKLVDRFNDILAELTVDQALDKSQKRSPKRYMIFPDTHTIQDFELQLLARLINGFPTSNINLVLVVNQNDPYEEKLSVFGKNMLQWILESENPSGAPKPGAKKPKKSNRIETLDETPKESLDAIADFSATFAATLASGKFPAPGAPSKSLPKDGAELKGSFDPILDSAPNPGGSKSGASEQHSNQRSALKGSLSTKIVGILIFAIVASVGAIGLIYQDEVLKQAKSLEDFVSGKKPGAAKAEKDLKTPAPSTEVASKPAESNPVGTVGTVATAVPATPSDPGAAAPTGATGATGATVAPVTPGTPVTPLVPSSAGAPGEAKPPAPTPVQAPPGAPTTPTPSTVVPNKPVTSGTPATAQTPSASPNSSVGMSSSTKMPVKTDDSLIPNKEVVISTPPATVTPNTKAPNQVLSKVTPVAPPAPPTQNPTAPTLGEIKTDPKINAKTDAKADVKTEVKTEVKAEPKRSVREDLKSPPPNTQAAQTPQAPQTQSNSPKAVNAQQNKLKETPELKEAKEAKEMRDSREVKESKPFAKTPTPPAIKEADALPKLAPKPEKTEEKPKSSASDNSGGFKPRPEDQRWIQQLPEDAWVMQHAALDTMEEALSFQQSSPFYKDGRVMYTKRREAAPYYIVVTGPYSSRQDAESEIRKHPIMSKSWVRSARSIKNQFED
jgi:hypothetical protein